MALALTAYGAGMGFTLSRLAYNIPNGFPSRGPLATMRAMDDVKVIVLNIVTGNSVNGLVFPSDADEQDFTVATSTSARDARSACRLNGVNYVYDRSDFPSLGDEGIRLLLDTGAVPATAPIVNVADSGETNESLVSNAVTSRLYAAERIDATHYDILEIDPIAQTKTVKYTDANRIFHFAFNGDGDRIYLATNTIALTDFRIVELSFPDFTLVQSHAIGNYICESIICYNPPSGAARIVAQCYVGATAQFYDIDLSTDVITAITSGSVNGDGMNVDPLEGRRAFLTQLTEVYKLLAPAGGSFTDSAPMPPPDEPDWAGTPAPTTTYTKGDSCDTDYLAGDSCDTDYTGEGSPATSWGGGQAVTTIYAGTTC